MLPGHLLACLPHLFGVPAARSVQSLAVAVLHGPAPRGAEAIQARITSVQTQIHGCTMHRSSRTGKTSPRDRAFHLCLLRAEGFGTKPRHAETRLHPSAASRLSCLVPRTALQLDVSRRSLPATVLYNISDAQEAGILIVTQQTSTPKSQVPWANQWYHTPRSTTVRWKLYTVHSIRSRLTPAHGTSGQEGLRAAQDRHCGPQSRPRPRALWLRWIRWKDPARGRHNSGS